MKLFKDAVGLVPNTPARPSEEFLIRLITGHHTHAAWMRQILGDEFRNFENLMRGKTRSRKTLQRLSEKLGIKPQELQACIHGNADGPLLPELPKTFQIVERLPSRIFEALTAAFVPCPHCGGSLIVDTDVWWAAQQVGLEPAECRFIDRLLNATLGVCLLEAIINRSSSESLFETATRLCQVPSHPIGNWLKLLQEHFRCRKSMAAVREGSGSG